MLVSIITPTYDRSLFHKTLSKIVQDQTYRKIEHVVVEERESFEKHGILVEGAKHHILDIPRLGMADKRNKCVELSSGDIVVNFDSDDYYNPRYIASVVELFEQNCAVTVNTMFLYVLSQRLYYTARNRPFWGSGGSYLRKVWQEIKYPQPKYDSGEDTQFFKKIIERYGMDNGRGLRPSDVLGSLMLAMRHGSNITLERKRGTMTRDHTLHFLKSRIIQPEIFNFYLENWLK